MQTYLIMGKFTDKGIANVKQTTERADKFREMAAKFGIHVLQIYWLVGEYDVVNIVEAPDDQALQALLVRVGAWGNVRTTTFRAFEKTEMDAIISRIDSSL
ncbi:MAG: GYD domain-containing protein [Nitrospinaceae bacterium]|nr:GYD domain-containing protein [Nitrospinaceae bacterium]NIR57021.1 GYD domain-containing protein [Nitrospinaceae bacterium]NIS87474.1 GYD domain-containing protein [Nitrospinaceae bacterium]NIT84328.1 GYD domain-containing protein [Nitrospinaceae bacterium]NIU46517.1 GYD domain-containing protein [Nitrospinaceae bacterium]